jgi:hypothetical protein
MSGSCRLPTPTKHENEFCELPGNPTGPVSLINRSAIEIARVFSWGVGLGGAHPWPRVLNSIIVGLPVVTLRAQPCHVVASGLPNKHLSDPSGPRCAAFHLQGRSVRVRGSAPTLTPVSSGRMRIFGCVTRGEPLPCGPQEIACSQPCSGVEFPVAVKRLFRPRYVTWRNTEGSNLTAGNTCATSCGSYGNGLRVYKELTPTRKDQVDLSQCGCLGPTLENTERRRRSSLHSFAR